MDEQKVETRGRKKGQKDSKPRKPRSDHPVPIWSQTPVLAKGYNGALISNLVQIVGEPELHDPDCIERWERFKAYLRLCAEQDMKVGNQMSYLAAGLNRWDIDKWTTCGNADKVELIKKIRQICTVYREQLMADGKVNPAVGIFWQKNYDGLKDQVENVVTANMPMGGEVTGRDAERLAETYLGNADGALPSSENMPKCDDK